MSVAGDPDSGAAFAASPTDTPMPGGMYRNSFWVPYPGSAVLLCLGIHGQMVHVSTAANMVGVKLSSWPVPQDPVMLSATLRVRRHHQAPGRIRFPDRPFTATGPRWSSHYWHQSGALGDERAEDRRQRARIQSTV